MMALESLLALEQTEDFHGVCDAVDTVAQQLRRHELDEEGMAQASEMLLRLAQHKKWEVRFAVAHALRYLRHGAVDTALERLREDDAARVQKAAAEALERRAERAQLDLLPYLQDERLEKMLEKLTPQARKAALRIGAAYAEFMMRGLYHEAVRAMTPVNTSLMVLEQALKSPIADPVDTGERVQQFREKLRHVRAILNAARMFTMEAPPEYGEVSARALVDHALSTVKAHELARENGVEEEIDIDASLRLQGDPTLLQQVFENILKNALEASATKKPVRLTVTAKRVKGRVRFAFTDYGCGMTAEGRRDLFRPYRSKKKGGTGLGMPLVKKLVEMDHKGEVEVTSAPDVGTTVTIDLPLRQMR
jgi:signal transduction histidine kinase